MLTQLCRLPTSALQLYESRREASTLATQLEEALQALQSAHVAMQARDRGAEAEVHGQVADLAAELEHLRRDSADSQMQAVSARGRISILEKAFSAAQEVRGWL